MKATYSFFPRDFLGTSSIDVCDVESCCSFTGTLRGIREFIKQGKRMDATQLKLRGREMFSLFLTPTLGYLGEHKITTIFWSWDARRNEDVPEFCLYNRFHHSPYCDRCNATFFSPEWCLHWENDYTPGPGDGKLALMPRRVVFFSLHNLRDILKRASKWAP